MNSAPVSPRKMLAGGKLYDATLNYADLATVTWGLLLAPRGIQVSQMAFKFFERSVPNDPRVEVLADRIEWHPAGAEQALIIDLEEYFRRVLDA